MEKRLKYTDPILDTHEVVWFTKLPYETHQTWLRRGVVKLSTPSPGRGRQRLYSAADTMLLSVFADLSFLNQPPALFKEPGLAISIMGTGRDYYEALTEGRPDKRDAGHEMRFLALCYNWLEQEILWSQQPSPVPYGVMASPTQLVVDLYSHILRVMYYIANVKGFALSPLLKEEVQAYNEICPADSARLDLELGQDE